MARAMNRGVFVTSTAAGTGVTGSILRAFQSHPETAVQAIDPALAETPGPLFTRAIVDLLSAGCRADVASTQQNRSRRQNWSI